MPAAVVPSAPLATGAREQGPVLVVIGGLPGSGKTTLLRQLLRAGAPELAGLDSEQVTTRLRQLGVRLPYRLLRPFVHSWHRWRVLRTVRGAVPVVVLTDPWTSPRWRRTVLRAARRAGRSVRLVLIEATPELARTGQTARGRALSARAMRRHTRRWGRLRQALAEQGGRVDRGLDRGLDNVVVLDRQHAAALTVAEVLGRAGP